MATTIPQSGSSQALASLGSPVCQTETPPVPMSDIPLISMPTRAFTHQVPHQSPAKKWVCSPNGASDDCPGKRACAKAAEAVTSSGQSTPQGDRKPPKTPPEAHDNGMGASGSTGEHNSENNTNHCGDNSTQDESKETMADSDLD